MKVKNAQNDSIYSKNIVDFVKRKKLITRWLLGLVGLAGLAFMFFAVIGYGAYLKKVDKTTYYKNTLLKIAELDFSFLKNYTSGKMSEFDELKFDIKFRHMLRLKYLREKALENGYIDEASKAEEFPAKLTIGKQTYDVKIGMTGLTTDHLADPSKWSFQVKGRRETTIKGMKRFGLLIPKARGYMTDWLGFEILKERGLMGLRVDFVNVTVNGKSQGIYYMEERFDKHLLENNSLRESIIFKIEEDLKPYKESKLMANPDSRANLLLLKRMWQDVMAGNLPPEKFFDLEKMAKVFVVADLLNNKHPLYPGNLRFYFNPYTGLAEPIAREFGSLHRYDISKLAMWLEKPKEGNYRHARLREDKILKKIYDNLEFKRHYIQEAELMSQTKFLDSLFIKNGKKLNALLKKVYLTWPFYEFPTTKLYENQAYIRSTLHPPIDEILAYFKQANDKQLSVYLRNQQYLPIEVSHIGWRDSIFFQPKDPIILDSREKLVNDEVQLFDFEVPPGMVWTDSLLAELKIYYNMLGLPAGKKETLVYPWSFENSLEYAFNPIATQDANYKSFGFIKESEDKNTIWVPEGKWTISEDLIIPKNKNFELKPGAQLDLVNKARIICHSTVFSKGTEEKPVVIKSSDASGRGMLIIRANRRSQLIHTIFDQLNQPEVAGWSLPGAISFYESPVTISNCTFSNNIKGDDFLNIVRSDFSMDYTVFENINADAFDCDFCTGTIQNSSFIKIGNDGIDVSGTKLEVYHVSMNHVGDKGLSAGEDSEVEARWLDIKNAAIGITSKDKSSINIADVQLKDCDIGVTLFQKKSEFGPAFIKAQRISDQNSKIPYLIEENSNCIVDGELLPPSRKNVKEILYGAEYGKSSK